MGKSSGHFRWPSFDLNFPSQLFSSISSSSSSWRWSPRYLFRWPEFRFNVDFSFVDDALWLIVTIVESVALVSMLCFFFVFCGCNI